MPLSPRRAGILFGAAILLVLVAAMLLFRSDSQVPRERLVSFDTDALEVEVDADLQIHVAID